MFLRPPAKDAFGDQVAGSTTQIAVPGCLVAPGHSTETLVAADTVASDMTVYAPAGTPEIRPTDRALVAGKEYTVAGDPQDWGSAGLVIALRRVTG